MEFETYIPTKVLFGAHKLQQLHQEMIPGKKALIVISGGKSVKENGYLDELIHQLTLASKDHVIYDKIEANPTLKTINVGGQYCKEMNCDLVVALGGGSVIDSAKAIALLANNSQDMWDYIHSGTGGHQIAKHDPLPIIAIPTTAGTGSEIDCAGAFTNMETNEKVAFKDERLFPLITIIDPILSSSVPQKYTAYQGWDALTHSMENYMNKNEHEESDMLAREAIRYGGHYLTQAVNHGDDMAAREKMAYVSYLSGKVIHMSGTSSQHALECAMSALYPKLPHGAGLIMLSKAYFQFFIDKHVCDERFIEMARLLGNSDAKDPNDYIKCIEDIQKACHVDDLKMSDYGIKEDDFKTMIDISRVAMPGNYLNDRYQLTDEDCLMILHQSYR